MAESPSAGDQLNNSVDSEGNSITPFIGVSTPSLVKAHDVYREMREGDREPIKGNEVARPERIARNTSKQDVINNGRSSKTREQSSMMEFMRQLGELLDSKFEEYSKEIKQHFSELNANLDQLDNKIDQRGSAIKQFSDNIKLTSNKLDQQNSNNKQQFANSAVKFDKQADQINVGDREVKLQITRDEKLDTFHARVDKQSIRVPTECKRKYDVVTENLPAVDDNLQEVIDRKNVIIDSPQQQENVDICNPVLETVTETLFDVNKQTEIVVVDDKLTVQIEDTHTNEIFIDEKHITLTEHEAETQTQDNNNQLDVDNLQVECETNDLPVETNNVLMHNLENSKYAVALTDVHKHLGIVVGHDDTEVILQTESTCVGATHETVDDRPEEMTQDNSSYLKLDNLQTQNDDLETGTVISGGSTQAVTANVNTVTSVMKCEHGESKNSRQALSGVPTSTLRTVRNLSTYELNFIREITEMNTKLEITTQLSVMDTRVIHIVLFIILRDDSANAQRQLVLSLTTDAHVEYECFDNSLSNTIGKRWTDVQNIYFVGNCVRKNSEKQIYSPNPGGGLTFYRM